MTLVLPKFSARSIQCRSMKSRSSRLIAVVCCQAINFFVVAAFRETILLIQKRFRKRRDRKSKIFGTF